MIRLIQITDCHVSARADTLYRGEDAREHLDWVCAQAQSWNPDLVLATGDLSEDGSDASYQFVAAALEQIGAPVMATPGNHDELSTLRQHFQFCAGTMPLVFEDQWRIVVLNSATPGQIAGQLGCDQLEALRTLLAEDDRPVLLAFHHQPWPVGSPWIDRYGLLDPEPLQELLAAAPACRLILWGHVHQDVQVLWKHITGLGGPSSVSNSLPGQEKFTADPAGPACRWLDLHEDGTFETGLLQGTPGP